MVFSGLTSPYELPPYRPPSEANSLLLRVTRGCPWNKCGFCAMYKKMRFEVRMVDEVKEDIDTAMKVYRGSTRKVFLGDSDSIIIKTSRLVEILDYMNKAFPNLERITSYGRAATLCRQRTMEELRMLNEAGLKRLHVGLETGDEELLRYINKGAAVEEMVKAGLKALDAGFELTLYVILGLGGRDRSKKHAEETARVLNKINPTHIRVRTLAIKPHTPLYEKMSSGEFKTASSLEVLKETRLLIQNLNVTSHFYSDHVSNYLPINGKLPEDQNQILGYLDLVIDVLEASPELTKKILTPEYLRYL